MRNWFISFLIFIPALSQAQVLCLDEAIQLALANNYDVFAASQSKEVARLQNHIGNAGMLPTISLNGSANYGLNSLRQEFSSGLSVSNPRVNSRQFGADASLDWVIFDGLNMFAVKKQLRLQEEVADLSLRDQMLVTISDVIKTYTTLAAESKRLQGLEKTVAYFDELAQLAESRLKIGTGNRQEALQAKIDGNAQRSLILQQRAYLRQLKMQLNVLLNRDAATEFEADTLIGINDKLVLEESLGNAATANPSVMIADKNAAIFKAQLKQQQSYQMPRVAVNLAYSYNYSGSSAGFALFNQTHGAGVGAGVSFPIFDGWRVRRNIRTARVQYETAKYATDYTKLRIAAEIRMAYVLYEQQVQILALEQENIKLAEDNMNIAAERYKTGVGTLIESRAATLSFSDAQTRYAQAQSNAKAAETDLLSLTGQLIK